MPENAPAGIHSTAPCRSISVLSVSSAVSSTEPPLSPASTVESLDDPAMTKSPKAQKKDRGKGGLFHFDHVRSINEFCGKTEQDPMNCNNPELKNL